MKKLLVIILCLAMLSSLAAVLAIPASAAVDGEWIVYSNAGYHVKDEDEEEEEEDDEDLPCIPGYEYNDEGLRVIPADWKDYTPSLGVQTKNMVNLKDGVYMLVRVDDFTYANDKWFCVNINDRPYVSPGTTNVGKYGQGVQTLIRPSNDAQVSGVQWQYGAFVWDGIVNMSEDAEKYDENGKILIALTITWDGASYAMDINGSAAPNATIAYMNEYYADGDAYIGFNMMNSNKGGTAACTVLAFGTSKDDATIPMGDDSREPENNYRTIAEIADPSTVEDGKPAVFINGSKTNSDAKSNTGKSKTDNATLNDDFSIHYVADRTGLQHTFHVKNSVSYSIDDFPVVCILTRNLCTCGTDGECYALESANLYLMTGEITAPSDSYKITELDMCYEPIVKDDDSYLYFYADMSDEYARWDAEGRINGARFDTSGIQYTVPGFNAYDLCWIAFFRNIEEVESFVYEWVGVDPNAEPETTEQTVETIETVEVVTGQENDAEKENETKVDAPAGNDTAVETDAVSEKTENVTEEGTDAPASGGCGSTVGFGSIAVIALTAIGFVTAKKRREE